MLIVRAVVTVIVQVTLWDVELLRLLKLGEACVWTDLELTRKENLIGHLHAAS